MLKKSIIFILPFILLLSALIIYIFYPRNIEHGIIMDMYPNKSTFYIGNNLKTFNSKQLSFSKYDVVNFKYNLLKAYDFEKLDPIQERVMIKGTNYYDLEERGMLKLNNSPNYYELNNEERLSPTNSKKLIIGKNNVKTYVDSQGFLKTFILSPIDYSYMRVAISTTNFNSIYHERLQLKTLDIAKIYSLREAFDISIDSNTTFNIEIVENSMRLTVNNITKEFKERFYIKGASISINNIQRGSPTFTPSYSGVLEVTVSQKGLLIINELELENYLTKVVPSEMPASSAIESLKCQAIAARTYAISDMSANRFANLGFYVDDSTQSQVYNNMQPHPRSSEAIFATKGMIMTYEGNAIDAKYYSTSAGTGVNYSDIWFNSDGSSDIRPYLTNDNYLTPKTPLPKSEDDWLSFYKNKSITAIDSDSPYFRWYAEFTETELTNSLNKSIKPIYENRKEFVSIKKENSELNELPEFKKLQDIKAISRSEGGNLIKLAFIFENVTVEVAGDYNIRSSIRCGKDFTGGNQVSIIRHKSTPISSNFLPSSFFSVEKVKDKFIIYGGGYGHGVGMSQYGAMELGKKGESYDTILKTFYKSISLDTLY